MQDALESLEETFSSLEELSADSAGFLSLDGGEWDPNLLLEALDAGVGNGSSTVDRPSNPLVAQGQQPKKKKTPKKNKNKARDERRFLLFQLREEADRLQLTLNQLRTIRSKQPKGNEHPSHSTAQDSGVPAVWQEICARQLQRRMTTERENIQLKLQVEKEKELAKSLAKLLYRRKTPKTQGSEAQKQARRTDVPAGYIERMAAFIFEELSVGVEELCHQVEDLCLQVDVVLEISCAFPAVQRPLLRDGVKGREEKLLDTRVLPFSMQATGDAWWRNWQSYRGRSIQDSGERVVERFGVDMSDFNVNTSIASYGQQVLKRGVGDHRIAFVWNAYMEPFIFENERVSGLYFLEQCLVLIKPDQDECSSCMSMCYVITPYVLDSKVRDNPKTSALIDFFVGSLVSTMKERCEIVENMLFDQALEELTVNHG